jgi:hypothetical protein
MTGWPADELEGRASDIATVAQTLLARQAAWRHRRVETITVLSHEQVRRAVSVDFTVPAEYRDELAISAAGECVVPLALLARRPLVHFDLRNEEGHSVPLLTARQNAMIDRELLRTTLQFDLERQRLDESQELAASAAASPLIEAIIAGSADPGSVESIEREHGLDPLVEFRGVVADLSTFFVLWAVLRDLDRRRVIKFAYDEFFSLRPGFRHAYPAPGAVEAASYHVEVAVPADLKARATALTDRATGAVLAVGERDTDRPAVYYVAGAGPEPAAPGLVVGYGAERGRFLVPAAIVAAVITLLVALPRAFADLGSLAGSAGPAIGIVLSTSAVFSALVLRTDEHPLLRLMLIRHRLALVASTLAALLAAAALGFRANASLLDAVWGAAAAVSAAATAILIVALVRAPSAAGRRSESKP